MGMHIAVKSCEAHWDRVYAQRGTWAWDYHELYFPLTGKMLGVPDDYGHLPHKTKAICNYFFGDYLFLCDTDTYVHAERLISGLTEPHDYVGHALEINGIPYASGGAGYWLSRKAMDIIAREAVPDHFPYEDYMVGATLYEHRIPLHHDPRYTLALDSWPEPGNDLITKHLSMNGPYKVEMMYKAHRRAHDLRWKEKRAMR
jgi:hypothetical protein